MMRQLAEVGITDIYQRFPAVDGRTLGAEYVTKLDRGNLGLWLTHERLLAANNSIDSHLHLLEDDALFPKDADICFTNLLAAADKEFPDWDLIFTDVFLNLDFGIFELINKCRESHRQNGGLKLYSLKNAPFAGSSSFFINRNSIKKYLRVLEGRWAEGMPIDIFLRTRINQGLLNAYVTLPFATSLSRSTNESDIRGELDLSRMVLNLYRAAAKFILSDQWVGF
jgi:hypothetical protein